MILIAESPSRRTEYRRYLGNAGLKKASEAADNALVYVKENSEIDLVNLQRDLAAPIHKELSQAYLNGKGTKPDELKAYELMKKAAEFGLRSAMRKLAGFYQSGTGTRKNLADISQMTFNSQSTVDEHHHRWKEFRSAAIRQPRFDDLAVVGSPFDQFSRHPDTPFPSFSPGHRFSGLRRNGSSS